jgi:hypothetical protein
MRLCSRPKSQFPAVSVPADQMPVCLAQGEFDMPLARFGLCAGEVVRGLIDRWTRAEAAA